MNALIMIALALCGAANGDPAAADAAVDVLVSVSPPVAPFHKQVSFSVSVDAPSDLETKFPEMANKFGGLNVSGAPQFAAETLKDGRKRRTETYVLDPILIGEYVPQPVEITWGDGQKLVVPSPVIRIRDLTPEETEAAMRFEPNTGPITPSRSMFHPWAWITGAALLTAAGWAWYAFRRRRKQQRIVPPPPPWEIAYKRLRELDLRQLPKTGQGQTYYVELSSILRWYIEDRFSLRAPEQTTPEFLAAASGSGAFNDAQQTLLAQFLRHCDRVKFAQYDPSLEEMEHSFAHVLQFVDETVPILTKDEVPSSEEKAA